MASAAVSGTHATTAHPQPDASSHNAPSDKHLNLVWLAQSRLRRRRFDECIAICTSLLERNPFDQVCAVNAACVACHSGRS